MRSYTHDLRVYAGTAIGRVGSVLKGYPEYLENGTSKMAARPSLLPAVNAISRKARGMFVAALVSDKSIAEVSAND